MENYFRNIYHECTLYSLVNYNTTLSEHETPPFLYVYYKVKIRGVGQFFRHYWFTPIAIEHFQHVIFSKNQFSYTNHNNCSTLTKPNRSSGPHNTNQIFSVHETRYQTILGNRGTNHQKNLYVCSLNLSTLLIMLLDILWPDTIRRLFGYEKGLFREDTNHSSLWLRAFCEVVKAFKVVKLSRLPRLSRLSRLSRPAVGWRRQRRAPDGRCSTTTGSSSELKEWNSTESGSQIQ